MTMENLVGGLGFIEGARWHDGKLWLSDIPARQVVTIGLDGELEEVAALGDEPSGLGFAPDGALLVATMEQQNLLRIVGDDVQVVADVSKLAAGRCNDMVTDRFGRSYVGVVDLDPSNMGSRSGVPMCLVRVDPDGQAEIAAADMEFPNGAGVTEDGRTLIVAESMAQRLTAFAIDPASGALSDRRVFAELPEGVYPDGMCLDAEGCAWVASPVGRELLRVAEGGEISARLPTEGHALTCALGGDDRRTLFALTVPALDIQESAKRKEARVDFIRVDVPGAGLP